AIGGPGGDPELGRETRRFQCGQAVPNHLAGVADLVRVVEKEEIEVVGSGTGERFLGRHLKVVGVRFRGSESRIGEAGKSFRTVPLTFIKIMADRTDEAIAISGEAFQ